MIESSCKPPRTRTVRRLPLLCPEEPEPGKPLKFKANVVGGKPKFEISYNWTVDKGKITFGQGTSAIEVDLEGRIARASPQRVELGGVDPKCTEACFLHGVYSMTRSH